MAFKNFERNVVCPDRRNFWGIEVGIVAKSSLSGIDSIRGTILDPDNKNGIWKKVFLRWARLKPNTDLKEDAVREIVKGDFDKVWAILQQRIRKVSLGVFMRQDYEIKNFISLGILMADGYLG